MQLRDYQTGAVEQVKQILQQPDTNPVLVVATGGGKTVMMGHLTQHLQNNCYQAAIAHRRELVSQIALAYAKFGIPHRIVGPSTTVQEARRAQLEELGKSFVDQNARVGVCSVDTLVARDMAGDTWARSVAVAHLDEFHHCFPSGTLIDGRAISSLRVGDTVTAFDEKTGEFHSKPVTHVFKHDAPKHMVRITTAHHVLESTMCHPYWTQRGWVKAGELTDDDYLYALPNGVRAEEIQHSIPLAERGSGVLREQPLRVCVPGREPHLDACAIPRGNVPGVWQELHRDRLAAHAVEARGDSVLRHRLLEGVQISPVVGDDGANESQIRFRADEGEQSDDAGRRAAENDRQRQGSKVQDSGRQRSAADEGRVSVDGDVRAARVFGAVRLSDGAPRPNTLQDRLRAPLPENSHRGGRALAQLTGSPSVGRSQGCETHRCRVESVEVYESADSRTAFDGFVYNIEVADLHTYTVDGVVVHNCLRENKWGKSLAAFPNLKHAVGYTATPRRADRKGLGKNAQGIATHMVEGPPMWQLIQDGYLTPYKLITGNVTDLDLSTVSVAASGDYNPQKLRGAMKRSRQIVGDAVSVYRQYCDGRKAVLFACDVEDAVRYAEAFNAAGYPSAVVTAETKEDVRRDTMRRFRTGELMVLMNVDLFGEGFDLPAIECVLMCRPTKSLPLYQQQFGRALRLMVDKQLLYRWHEFTPGERRAHIAASAKPHAYIIDLVRNWAEPAVGGLPDARGRVWSLDGAEARSKGPSDVPPVRACTNPEPVDASGMLCTGVYERFLTACPFCGYAPAPAGRTIEHVDGDVVLLDEETLRQLRGEYLAAHTTPSYGGPHAAALYARHRERHEALTDLQRVIEWWGPCYEIEQGRRLSDREQQKAFFLVFGITTLEALALKRADAEALRKKVLDWMELKGFTIPA